MPQNTILPQDFFNRPVLTILPELLGKYLVQQRPQGEQAAHMISEVEAYDGEEDLACHAAKGRTSRTATLYGPPGHWYVYLCYGMYHMLNIVTGPEHYPAAILIRGLSTLVKTEPLQTIPVAKGPGILTRELSITRALNGQVAAPESGFWLEDRGLFIPEEHIERTARIGVHYAGEWAEKPYRLLLKSGLRGKKGGANRSSDPP